MIQLPNDVKAVGYKQVRPYQWEQVFCSSEKGFTGTANEFLRAGNAYEYIQVTNSRRYCY